MTREELLDRYAAGELDFTCANLARANLARANLEGANLEGSDLTCADLYRAHLYRTNLARTNLASVNLVRANLVSANLEGSDLAHANLVRANIEGANICRSNLYYANLAYANLYNANIAHAHLYCAILPAPQMVLLAQWDDVSPELCTELMRYDAASHPDPESFDRWAAGGPCPYESCHVSRAANFTQRPEHWVPGPSKSPYELMCWVLDEKCPGWR